MFLDVNFYKNILENLSDGIYFVDLNRRISYWNKGAEEITGYPASRVLGRRCQDNILNHVSGEGIELCNTSCPLLATMEDGVPRQAEVFLRHANGHRLPVLVRTSPIRNVQGKIIGSVETFSNNTANTEMRRRNEQLQKTVLLDPLTGLSNRRHIELRTRAECEMFRETGNTFGILFGDIDHFKHINDTYGHIAGDSVLKMIANTLRRSLRTTDTIGRWGGEEFVILVNDITLENLEKVAQKVRVLVEQSKILVGGISLQATISIGATLINEQDTPESLLQRADQLMYESKAKGRNCISIR